MEGNMRIKDKKAKTKHLFPFVGRLFRLDFTKKHLSHSYFYKVSGEDLSERHEKRWKGKLGWTLVASTVLFFFFGYLLYLFHEFTQVMKQIDTKNLFSTKLSLGDILFAHWSIAHISLVGKLVLLGVSVGIGLFVGFWLDYRAHSITDGQKGDSRLTTEKEIKKQYKEVPDRTESFEGIGGVPISHCEDKMYISTETENTCFIGTSRSGKGQTSVFSLIDNVSRAKIQSALIVNDPKTELYTGSKETLEKRGYEVFAYNVLDPLSGMSDNPLALIIKYWKRGDIDTATELTNTFTNTIYSDPNAGDNKYFNENAQKAVNAIIFTLLDYADRNNAYEKVTPNNIVEMFTELGSLNYKLDEEDFNEKNALDEFMESLPAGNVAKKQYGSTKMGSDKARGNILSTAMTGLNPFTLPKVAKMTSISSLDYKSIGFPKYIDAKFHESLMGKRVRVNFYHEGKLMHKERLKVEYRGFAELNFNCELVTGDVIEFVFTDSENETFKARYTFTREVLKDNDGNIVYQKKEGCEHLPDYNKYATMTLLDDSTMELESLEVHYSEKPIAIFMLTPDFNSANHVLVSIFLKQVYTELSSQCVKTRGDKCHRRIHYVLDEFGNMPAVADMENVMTVTAGRNMLWDLFVQSYSQIYAKYGEEVGNTIKENCQTHILIMTTDDNTIEEFSKKVGHRTVQQEQAQTNLFGMNTSISRNADQERILTPERISTLLEGETIVLRPLKRRDNKGRKIRPFPIFNTKKTVMPYAYQYLKEFQGGGDIQDIDIESRHASIDLANFQLDYLQFLVDDQAKRAYLRQRAA
ncbi:type IV secretory system conjugative DNA transfer family protein [Enterococcus faecalis]